METKLVQLRKELDARIIQTRYENCSKVLYKIITTQRDPSNKKGIGYSQEEKLGSSKSYAVALVRTFKKKEDKTSNVQNSKRLFPPIKKEVKTTPKKVHQNRYPHILFGYFFTWSNFKHTAMNCREYGRKKFVSKKL